MNSPANSPLEKARNKARQVPEEKWIFLWWWCWKQRDMQHVPVFQSGVADIIQPLLQINNIHKRPSPVDARRT